MAASAGGGIASWLMVKALLQHTAMLQEPEPDDVFRDSADFDGNTAVRRRARERTLPRLIACVYTKVKPCRGITIGESSGWN